MTTINKTNFDSFFQFRTSVHKEVKEFPRWRLRDMALRSCLWHALLKDWHDGVGAAVHDGHDETHIKNRKKWRGKDAVFNSSF